MLVPSTSQARFELPRQRAIGTAGDFGAGGLHASDDRQQSIPVGMEFLGREFTEGELLQIAFSWEQATHIRQRPRAARRRSTRTGNSGSPTGSANFYIAPSSDQLRFTGPGLDTFVYIDPAMHDVKGRLIGEFKDEHWKVRYSVPDRLAIGGRRSSKCVTCGQAASTR